MLRPFLTLLLFLIVFPVFTGCAPKQDKQSIQLIALNQEFITRVGQYHMTPDKDVIFGISKIVEDSRGSCGKIKNTSCVWDGAITVELKVTDLSGDGGTKYQTGMAHQRQYFGNYLLEIRKVVPRRPKKNHEKYRFTFEVTRLSNDEILALERQKEDGAQALQEGRQKVFEEQIASIRERYENIDPKILSHADAEEIIAIEQKQARFDFEFSNRFIAWQKRDPATRGPWSEQEADPREREDPRLQELQVKARHAREVQTEIDRIKKLSKTHDMPILDNELSELIRLHTEQQTYKTDIEKAVMKALVSEDGQFNSEALNGGQLSGEVIGNLPKDILRPMFEIEQRLAEIQAPFEAAETADILREQIANSSEITGAVISSGEIEEVIALNAEKDGILKRTQTAAGKKWLADGGPVAEVQNPLPSAADAARLAEIEARLKAISERLIQSE